MAAFPREAVSDRLLRVETWREEARHDNFQRETSLPAQLCVESIAFYRRCLRQLSKQNGLQKQTFTQLSRNYEALALWAQGFDIARGGIDEVLVSSRRARRCYLESLTSLCTTLLSRLLPLCPALHLVDEARDLERTFEAAIVCLEDTYQDGDSVDSTKDGSSALGQDSIDEVIRDLEIDVNCLIDMDPLLSCPADRNLEEPRNTALETWAPHQAICDRIANRFPGAKEGLVQRLGKATWDSFLRCKGLREHREEQAQPQTLDDDPSLPVPTVAISLRSKDSGLGSLLPTMSYAETVMSYRRQDGESVKVPPLPKTALDGVPFECIVCGVNLVAKTNSTWKNHLFNDLRPYICVFQPCPRAAVPFETHQEWISHTVYHIELRAESDFERLIVKCPLCLEDMKRGYSKHLSAHLEEIALGAVPLHADADSDSSTSSSSDTGEELTFDQVLGYGDFLPSQREHGDKCQKCDQTGHPQDECPEGASRDNATCSLCQKTGHLASDCPDHAKESADRDYKITGAQQRGESDDFKDNTILHPPDGHAVFDEQVPETRHKSDTPFLTQRNTVGLASPEPDEPDEKHGRAPQIGLEADNKKPVGRGKRNPKQRVSTTSTFNSCYRCVRQRIRCEGNHPCGSCKELSLPCLRPPLKGSIVSATAPPAAAQSDAKDAASSSNAASASPLHGRLSRIRSTPTMTRVWDCCACEAGGMGYEVSPCCPSCVHVMCTLCRVYFIKAVDF